jgi:hypothetical protein
MEEALQGNGIDGDSPRHRGQMQEGSRLSP